jgi:hypothetical protein
VSGYRGHASREAFIESEGRKGTDKICGVPVSKLIGYLGPKQLDALYDSYGADNVHDAIAIWRRRGAGCGDLG